MTLCPGSSLNSIISTPRFCPVPKAKQERLGMAKLIRICSPRHIKIFTIRSSDRASETTISYHPLTSSLLSRYGGNFSIISKSRKRFMPSQKLVFGELSEVDTTVREIMETTKSASGRRDINSSDFGTYAEREASF
jgi:hypothetical protein